MCDFTSLGLASAAVPPCGAWARVVGARLGIPMGHRPPPGEGGIVLIRELAPSYLQCL